MNIITMLIAYGFNAIINIVGYLPQIYTLIKNPHGHVGHNLATWVIWTYSTIIVFGASFTGHALILGINIYYKYVRKIKCTK